VRRTEERGHSRLGSGGSHSGSHSTRPDLVDAIRSLPPRRRLVVFLRYFGDLSYEEISEACGISEGTVAATLAQARADLLAAIDQEGAER
jgi:RNA polymerase sigma factor (sigma-70 family)